MFYRNHRIAFHTQKCFISLSQVIAVLGVIFKRVFTLGAKKVFSLKYFLGVRFSAVVFFAVAFPPVVFSRWYSPLCSPWWYLRVCFSAAEVSHESIHGEFFHGRVVRWLLLPEISPHHVVT